MLRSGSFFFNISIDFLSFDFLSLAFLNLKTPTFEIPTLEVQTLDDLIVMVSTCAILDLSNEVLLMIFEELILPRRYRDRADISTGQQRFPKNASSYIIRFEAVE